MALTLIGPDEQELRARITVFGVGGAGGNAVNNMIEKELPGVDFIAANTDAQALQHSQAPRAIQLGIGVTRGLGAGSKPEVGQRAAEETIEEIQSHLDGCHMCFITGGMGGGTGTGAAPTVARVAREMGILTVGVVTKPFHFEGSRRMSVAEAGLAEMQSVVDTLIVIPNQNLFQVASERTTFVEAFQMADDVLYQGVQGVTDLMVRPGMINLDFADVRSVMEEMGKAMMGTGEAEGETRAIDAAEKAIANPLLDEVSLKGARGVLINITGGHDLTLFEMDEAANRVKEEVDAEAMIKFGSAIDPALEGKMRVSVVATGIDAEAMVNRPPAMVPPSRRPIETDPGIVAAVRGQRRPETQAPVAEQPEMMPEPAPEPQPEPAMAEEVAVAEVQPEPMRAPEPEVAAAPSALATAVAAATVASEPAPAPVAEADAPVSDEARFATTPSPSDIRARADEVRQRALAARARKDEASRRNDFALPDDEPALFDLDEQSMAAVEPEAQPTAEAQDTGDQAPRGGLFTINKLIHRVAGQGQDTKYEDRPEPPSLNTDEDPGDIPAFLRRQAN